MNIKPSNPDSGLLHWLHIVIRNAKVFILGTYHGLPKKYFQPYLDDAVSVSVTVTLVPVFWSGLP